jgi:glutaredoxin
VAFQYVNVKKNQADLDRMLTYTQGQRRVPVIVEDDRRVTVGFGGT